MCKECVHCKYSGCLNTITNKVSCKLKDEEVLNKEAEACENFIPIIHINSADIEEVTEYNINHKCPYCGHEDTLYNVDEEDEEIIKCEMCGRKYSINWVIG